MVTSLSYSQMSQMACGRRWWLSYVEGLEKPPSLENEGRFFGTAFHAGMAAVMEINDSPRELVKLAVQAARKAIAEIRIDGKADYFGQPDQAYYEMLDRVDFEVTALLNWFVMEFPYDKYRVATIRDVFGVGYEDDNLASYAPMVEWEFSYPVNDEVVVKGFVDAVIIDRETGEIIVVDWKTRQSILPAQDALIDGQLHLYAAVITSMGGHVDSVRMWQVRKAPPAPVTLVDKNTRPSAAANAKATSRSMYLATLPEQLHLTYGDADLPSIKPDSYFSSGADAFVTDVSVKMTMDNLEAQAGLLLHYKAMSDKGLALPAQYSSHLCKGCPFVPLCSEPFRYGGDASALIDSLYIRKEGYTAVVEETD